MPSQCHTPDWCVACPLNPLRSKGGGAGGKSVDCGYTSIMGLALVCDGDDIVGPDVFCRRAPPPPLPTHTAHTQWLRAEPRTRCSSDCYRALSPFMTECRAQLNPMMVRTYGYIRGESFVWGIGGLASARPGRAGRHDRALHLPARRLPAGGPYKDTTRCHPMPSLVACWSLNRLPANDAGAADRPADAGAAPRHRTRGDPPDAGGPDAGAFLRAIYRHTVQNPITPSSAVVQL
jgi:hypothetical protein